MTVENSSIAPEAIESTEIDSEVSEGVDTPEVEEGDSIAPEDDPNESFEDWLKRQGEKDQKSAKEVKSDQKGDKSTQNEPKKSENTPKEEKKEEPAPTKIKIKDKEYTPEEIETNLVEADNARAEYNKIHKQAEQLVELLKTNPGQILDRLEVNKDVIEQWYYKKFIEPDLLTPEQRQAQAEKEELEHYRKQDEERQAKEDSERKERLKEQYRQEWSKRINEALDAAGLPKSDLVVSRMAHHMKQALANGKQNVQPAEVVDLVKQDLIDLQKSTITSLAPEKLAETLGEDTMAKLRKLEAEKFKQTKFENKNPPKGKPREIKKKDGKRYKSAYDLLDDL